MSLFSIELYVSSTNMASKFSKDNIVSKEVVIKNLLIFAKETTLAEGKVILSMVSKDDYKTNKKIKYKVVVLTEEDSILALDYKCKLLEYCIKYDISKQVSIDYEWGLKSQYHISMLATEILGDNIIIKYDGKVKFIQVNVKEM